jgi:hypothetical protein
MIVHGNPERWKCPECGSADSVTHCQEYCSTKEESLRSEYKWATKKQRDEDSHIAFLCEDAKKQFMPIPWVEDTTWVTCEKCGYELLPEEVEEIFAMMTEVWQAIWRGEGSFTSFTEEIGICVFNDPVIDKIDFNTKNEVKEEDKIPDIPLNLDIKVIGDDV